MGRFVRAVTPSAKPPQHWLEFGVAGDEFIEEGGRQIKTGDAGHRRDIFR